MAEPYRQGVALTTKSPGARSGLHKFGNPRWRLTQVRGGASAGPPMTLGNSASLGYASRDLGRREFIWEYVLNITSAETVTCHTMLLAAKKYK
jgi:hypothetical protein